MSTVLSPVQNEARLGLAVRQPVLELRNVTKRFSHGIAVNNVSIPVYDGEFLFLIGPSGCGKTTTLRMIGGYETPTSGEIVIRGHVVNNVPLERRNIGMVFQSYALFPHMTVWQNIEFGLRTRHVPKRRRGERVAAVLDLVELFNFKDRYPVQLSGGQRQRVALARVIVFEPDILLLDEPLANLDKRLRDSMRVELKKLQEKVGITTVYVTHDQEEALTMADRLAIMDQGDLLQTGSPSEVYNRPQSSFVAMFLGETSCFPARVTGVTNSLLELECGEDLRAAVARGGQFEVGDRVSVSIRPERVAVDTHRPSGTENAFPGVIDFVSYLGANVVYMIRLDGSRLLIRASEAIPRGSARFSAGERVFVSWRAEQAVCVKD